MKTVRMRVKSWEEIKKTLKGGYCKNLWFNTKFMKRMCGSTCTFIVRDGEYIVFKYYMQWNFAPEWLEPINNNDLIEEMNYLLLGILREREL